MEYIWKINKDKQYIFKAKNNDKESILKSLRKSLGKRKISFLDILSDNFNIKKCNVCGINKVHPYDIICDINNNILIINNIIYNDKIYCGCLNGKLNPNSFEFIKKAYNVDDITANNILKNRNKSPFYKENFENSELYSESQKRNLKWYIKKFGQIDGQIKYNEHCLKISESNIGISNPNKDSMSINFHIKKYGNNYIEFYNKRLLQIKQSKESFIKRHGDNVDAIAKWETHIELVRYNMSELYYIDKYGKDDGEKKWAEQCKKYSVTLDNLIKKYGKDDGTKRYEIWYNGVTQNGNKFKYSKESLYFFDKLLEIMDLNKYKIYYGDNEYFLRDNDKIFFYDFTIKELKIIIEYDTPFYHPNPFYMKEDEFNNWTNPFIKKTALEMWNKDYQKELLVKNNNFNFLRLYFKNKKDFNLNLNKAINFIKEYL